MNNRLYPTSFNLGGVEWSVIDKELLEHRHFGETSSVGATIELATSIVEAPKSVPVLVNQDVRNETFFHELLHAFTESLTIKIEESEVQQIAVLLHQFIKDKYILKGTKE
jgi:hypothetical protein